MERPYQGIDTAAHISTDGAQKLVNNGISFAARYLIPTTYGNALTKSEAQTLRDAGLAVMLCWETSAKRMSGGYAVGLLDGSTARKLAQEMGISGGTVIYFAADYAVPPGDYEAICQYLIAAAVAVQPYKAGLYGSENIVREMYEREACADMWQCVGGSNQFLPCAKVIQYESQYGTNAKALAAKVGFAVDLDAAESLAGMWLPDKPEEPEKPSTEAETAHKWAVGMGIVDDSMRDVSQAEIMLWRYHRLKLPDDDSFGGLISD